MNWRKSLEAALVSAGAAVFASAPALVLDGGLTRAEVISLAITFGAVFFSYLKTHLPNGGVK
jgi:hypothetical protein